LDLVGRSPPMDEVFSDRRAGYDRRPRDTRRRDRIALPSPRGFNRACCLGTDLLLHCGRDRAVHGTRVGGTGTASSGGPWASETTGVVLVFDFDSVHPTDLWRHVPAPRDVMGTARDQCALSGF